METMPKQPQASAEPLREKVPNVPEAVNDNEVLSEPNNSFVTAANDNEVIPVILEEEKTLQEVRERLGLAEGELKIMTAEESPEVFPGTGTPEMIHSSPEKSAAGTPVKLGATKAESAPAGVGGGGKGKGPIFTSIEGTEPPKKKSKLLKLLTAPLRWMWYAVGGALAYAFYGLNQATERIMKTAGASGGGGGGHAPAKKSGGGDHGGGGGHH